jgi:acetylornithine/succinyldiaminopimelate/putrescine aminotransferase
VRFLPPFTAQEEHFAAAIQTFKETLDNMPKTLE